MPNQPTDTKPILAPVGAEEHEKPAAVDPFDPDGLRVTSADKADMGVETVLVEVPCRKPGRQEWIMTNPELSLDTYLLKLEDSGEFYLVAADMQHHPDLFEMARPYHLRLAINRAGSVFLWPVPIPEDGTNSPGVSWHRSARKCQDLAAERWIRVTADMSAGAYVTRITAAKLPAPKWPDQNLRGLLRLSFGAMCIDTTDHPILKMLRGEE